MIVMADPSFHHLSLYPPDSVIVCINCIFFVVASCVIMFPSSSTIYKKVCSCTCSQATIPFTNGIAKWKASISLIPQDFALALSIGPLGFTLHVLSTSCLHLMSQRYSFIFVNYNEILSDGWYCYLPYTPSTGHGGNKKHNLQKRNRVPSPGRCHNLLRLCFPVLLGVIDTCCITGVWELLICMHKLVPYPFR